MSLIILSIIEGIYVYYMFNHFKTKISVHHPLEQYLFLNGNCFLKHPISTGIYESKICSLGQIVGKLMIFWFIGRYFISNTILMKVINKIQVEIL